MKSDSPQKEDIDIKFDSLVGELDESARQLNDSQKSSFKNIDVNNAKIFSKIEEHKKEFAVRINNVKTHFRFVYSKTNKSITALSSSANNVLGNLFQFELILIILLLPNIWELLVSIFPQYASIILIPSEYAKPVFILQMTFLIIVVIIFYKRIKADDSKITKLEAENISTLASDLKDTEELQYIPYNIDSELESQKNVATELKSSIIGGYTQIKNSIPAIKQIHDDEKYRKKWNLLCDNKKNVLTFFGFSKLEPLINKLKSDPDFSKYGFDDPEIEKSIVKSLSTGLAMEYSILMLLSDNYNARNTDIAWESTKKDNKLIVLTKILLNSKHLDISNKKIAEEELFEILLKTVKFDISLISKNYVLFQRIVNYFDNYRERLTEEGIILDHRFSNVEIIKNIDFDRDFQYNFLTIFSEELETNLDGEEKKSFVNALLAILLNRDIDFRRKVCQNASEDATIIILLGYHELVRKKQEKNQQFVLGDLLENQDIFIKINERLDKESESYEPELFDRFQHFKVSLSQGKWFDNEIFLMRAMLLKKFDEVKVSLKNAEKYDIIHKIIEKNFENINVNLVEKAIDANLFSTYVILTDAREGDFRNIIDILSIRDTTTKVRKTQFEIRGIEEKYGISIVKNGKPKYDFVKYSRGTRVGVLDRSTDFSEFKEELISAIAKILEKDPGHWNIGLAIVRITPSKYSFGIPESQFDNLGNVETKDLEIVRLIASLAQNYLEESEKAVIAHFDKNIDMLEIINQQSILNLISYDKLVISDEYKRFLDRPQLRERLFSELKSLEISTFKELAIVIHRNHIDKKKLSPIIKGVLSTEYQEQYNKSINPTKLDTFSIELINSLESVALLWNK